MRGDRLTLVDRLSSVLANRVDRRGFLMRSAVVGSAVAVAPVDYVLRPTTAYAAVCSCVGSNCDCGALCCDGYTEFCCSIYGANACPPGTAVAGWWKADGSAFCEGARYYMDCNAGCGSCGCGSSGLCSGGCSGTPCECANHNCNERRAGCNEFRYGQCNQHVACLGPIVCRLVTCIPPWEIEPSCTHTLAVDQATVSHDAPCLHAPNGGFVHTTVFGGKVTVTGWAVDNDRDQPIDVDLYVDGHFGVRVLANGAAPDSVPAHAGHGFTASLALGVGTHTICAYGINVGAGTTNPKMACETVQVTDNPVGHFESVTPGPQVVTVKGWAIDPDTAAPINVDVWVDGGYAATVPAGQPRPDVAAAYPGYGPNHGFSADVFAPSGTHRVCVYAKNTATGNANPSLGCRTVTVGGNPFGHLDSVGSGPGTLTLAGWVIDPDIADPVNVDIWMDGAYVTRVLANGLRADVGQAYPAYGPNHGFKVTVPAVAGTHTICAYGINTGTGNTNSPLGCRTVTVGGNPFGHLDSVGTAAGALTVAGWVIDPDTADPIDVDLYLDGVLAGRFAADHPRADVGQAYPAYGPNHGFNITVPAVAGTHTICAYGINTGSGNANPSLGCRSGVQVPS